MVFWQNIDYGVEHLSQCHAVQKLQGDSPESSGSWYVRITVAQYTAFLEWFSWLLRGQLLLP